MNEDSRLAFRRRVAPASAVLVLLALPALAGGGSANAGSERIAFDWTETYAGVFVGAGRPEKPGLPLEKPSTSTTRLSGRPAPTKTPA